MLGASACHAEKSAPITATEPKSGSQAESVAAPESAESILARESSSPDPTDAGPRFIPNTDVADTPENRRVVEFCERYRKALEARDDKALIALASRNYHDDDVDYATLETALGELMKATQAIRYEIRYRKVSRENGRVKVDTTYSASYTTRGNTRHVVEDNQLVLEPEGDSFRIVSGM